VLDVRTIARRKGRGGAESGKGMPAGASLLDDPFQYFLFEGKPTADLFRRVQ
jgi:hypothetical protein